MLRVAVVYHTLQQGVTLGGEWRLSLTACILTFLLRPLREQGFHGLPWPELMWAYLQTCVLHISSDKKVPGTGRRFLADGDGVWGFGVDVLGSLY